MLASDYEVTPKAAILLNQYRVRQEAVAASIAAFNETHDPDVMIKSLALQLDYIKFVKENADDLENLFVFLAAKEIEERSGC